MGYVTAVPAPRSQAGSDGPPYPGRRSLALALLCGALGTALALLASRQNWAAGTVPVAGGDFPLTATGSDVTGVPAALAIVGLAALVAVFAVRRTGRMVVSAVLALSGVGTVAAALLGATDGAALDERAAQISGDTSATIHSLTHTGWPYAAAAGGVLLLVAGLLAVAYGRRWPGMGGRYERGGSAPRPRRERPAAVDHDRPEDLWKALDRGEDPT